MQAAEWLGHKKTEAPFIPLWWINKAIEYMSAEAEGQKSLIDHKSRK